jgi:hypothetical protein
LIQKEQNHKAAFLDTNSCILYPCVRRTS